MDKGKFELFHDESMKKGFWHGMLLIPCEKKQEITDYLVKARNNTNYYDPIGIKKVKTKNRIFNVARAWLQIGIGFMRSTSKNKKYPIFFGELKKGKPIYGFLPDECVGAKFILFREKHSHEKMDFYSDHASKVETTFRMGLKGGLHFLGNEKSQINITIMHFDGHEHYQRNLDKTRIVDRLEGLREYCSISNRDDLIDDRNSDHRKDNSQSYEDCQLLQLTDLLIGGFRTFLGEKTREIHGELSSPIYQIIARYKKGYARMRHSRWFGSFCVSQCYLNDGGWIFEDVNKLVFEKENIKQLELFEEESN